MLDNCYPEKATSGGGNNKKPAIHDVSQLPSIVTWTKNTCGRYHNKHEPIDKLFQQDQNWKFTYFRIRSLALEYLALTSVALTSVALANLALASSTSAILALAMLASANLA